MTIEDLQGLTGISDTEIKTYYLGGLIGRQEDGEMIFDSGDAKKIGLIRRLEQFKMSKQDIEKFFSLTQEGETQKAVAILQTIREQLISSIHEEQKSLDILDCIIYETKNKKGGAL